MPAPYDYASATGYARARADWIEYPSETTLVRQLDYDRWDQALYDLKRERFRVRDYYGGGATQLQAIQAAIDDANAAYVANGVGAIADLGGISWTVLASVTLKSGVILENGKLVAGASMGGSGWVTMLQAYGTSVQVENIGLRGLVLDGNSQTTSPVLGLAGIKNVRAYQCVFKGTPAVSGNGCVTLVGGPTNGLTSALSSERITFEECEFGPSGDCGISLHGGNGVPNEVVSLETVEFVRCYVHDNNDNGISLGGDHYRFCSGVKVHGCTFKRNALTGTPFGNRGHLIDAARYGWVDLDVAYCRFLEGNERCAAVSDHTGRDIRIHHNHFEMGNVTNDFEQLTVALGENRETTAQRTWFAELHHNYFTDSYAWDFDSCQHVKVHHNVFYRNMGRPLGMFGRHYHTEIEDNYFIENGQLDPGDQSDMHKAGMSCARGVKIRRNLFIDDQTTQATLTTALTGTNNDLLYTAWDGGTAGNSIRVRYVDPGTPSAALSVTRSGLDITVNLATNGSSVITSTAAQVKAAVNASVAHPLVRVQLAAGNDGTGVVTALAFTSLAGGSATLAPTQLFGVVEISGDPDEGQGEIVYEGNDFANMGTPVQMVAAYDMIRRVDKNKGAAAVTLASAATITLPVHSDYFSLTGTTTITSITAAPRGREVTLVFPGSLQISDGSNLILAGNFAPAANSTITLFCDGTNWIERGRSTNA